jgi:hypothetical protein
VKHDVKGNMLVCMHIRRGNFVLMKSVGYFLQNPYHLQKKKKKIVGILQFIRIQITIYLKQYKNKFVFTKKN